MCAKKYSLQQRRSAAAEEGLKLEGEKFSSYEGTRANRLSKECNEKNRKSSKILIELTYF
jgi:hypothetical protein